MKYLFFKSSLLFFLLIGIVLDSYGQFKRIVSYSPKDIVIETNRYDLVVNNDTVHYLLSSELNMKIFNQKGLVTEIAIPKGFEARTMNLVQIDNDIHVLVAYNSLKYSTEDTSIMVFHRYTIKNDKLKLIDSSTHQNSYVYESYKTKYFLFFNLGQSLGVFDILRSKMTFIKVPKSKRNNQDYNIMNVKYLNEKIMLLTYGGEYYEIPKDFYLIDTFELSKPKYLLESFTTPISFKRNHLKVYKEGKFIRHIQSNSNYYDVDYDNAFYTIDINHFFIVSFNKVIFYSYKGCKIKKINEITFKQDFYGSIMSPNFFKVRNGRVFFDTFLIEEENVVIYELLWK
jgi:hypothetical protein